MAEYQFKSEVAQNIINMFDINNQYYHVVLDRLLSSGGPESLYLMLSNITVLKKTGRVSSELYGWMKESETNLVNSGTKEEEAKRIINKELVDTYNAIIHLPELIHFIYPTLNDEIKNITKEPFYKICLWMVDGVDYEIDLSIFSEGEQE